MGVRRLFSLSSSRAVDPLSVWLTPTDWLPPFLVCRRARGSALKLNPLPKYLLGGCVFSFRPLLVPLTFRLFDLRRMPIMVFYRLHWSCRFSSLFDDILTALIITFYVEYFFIIPICIHHLTSESVGCRFLTVPHRPVCWPTPWTCFARTSPRRPKWHYLQPPFVVLACYFLHVILTWKFFFVLVGAFCLGPTWLAF